MPLPLLLESDYPLITLDNLEHCALSSLKAGDRRMVCLLHRRLIRQVKQRAVPKRAWPHANHPYGIVPKSLTFSIRSYISRVYSSRVWWAFPPSIPDRGHVCTLYQLRQC